ncbi:MAG TPA: hypothetical protein VHC44_12155 [Verrucomicrobiae bacterium]|nr:hypothetical protein [Verrucomicrobiae bacterium]
MKIAARRFIRQFVSISKLLFVGFYISAPLMSKAQVWEISNGKWKLNTNAVLNPPVPSGADLPDDAPPNQVEDFRDFKKVATDKKSSDEKVFRAASIYLAKWCWEEDNGFEPVTRVLGTNRPPYLMKWIRGSRFVDLAWNARGGYYASEVVPSQWPIFEEYLRKAATELEAAWEVNPKQPLIAEEMMTVELGQGKGRDQLELWFQRAMQLDTNNVNACCQKLLYLEPKWYGSPKDEIAFGRECVASTNWGGKVPLMLVQAHRALTEYLPKEKRDAYWQLPSVWDDVQSAYNKYFKANPKDLIEHKNYAVLAYTGLHWDVLNEQIAVLGPDNYSLFGDEDKIFDIVGAAERHATKSNK